MRILFDQGTPVPLRNQLPGHDIATAHEEGWSTLSNGDLLAQAEAGAFELLITTDRQLRYQQNLTGRQLAILVLPTTSWPIIREHSMPIAEAINKLSPGEYLELSW